MGRGLWRKRLASSGLLEPRLEERVLESAREELRIRGCEHSLDAGGRLRFSAPGGSTTVVLASLVRACEGVQHERWPEILARQLGVDRLPLVAPRSLDPSAQREWVRWEDSTNRWSPRKRRDVRVARAIRDELLRRGYAFGLPDEGEPPPMRFELFGADLQVAVPGVDFGEPIWTADIGAFLKRCGSAPKEEWPELVAEAVDEWTDPRFWEGHLAKTRQSDEQTVRTALARLGDEGHERLRSLLGDELERRGFELISGDDFEWGAASYQVHHDLTAFMGGLSSEGHVLVDAVKLAERCTGAEPPEWPRLVSEWMDDVMRSRC